METIPSYTLIVCYVFWSQIMYAVHRGNAETTRLLDLFLQGNLIGYIRLYKMNLSRSLGATENDLPKRK